MLFNSMTFLWIFLPIVLILYFIVKEKYRNILLILASLIFYAWGDTKNIVLLVFSILINYIISLFISNSKKEEWKKAWFILGLVINIGILAYYKYFNFIVQNINKIFGVEIFSLINLKLPIGISFFTFSAISYLFDIYRGNIKNKINFINTSLYISFFPKLIMGPIERYCDFEKQIENRDITTEKFASGVKRFVYGLSKKVIIANTMGSIADYIFNANIEMISTPIAWVGAIAYMLQIYFDFSGYSDMAIGLGKLFGFELIENFNLPYVSQSITEFWRRWHISLSTWFKEYLYIPLGGNRKGKTRTYINLFIVFFITGLWHGSSWNYIAWGLFNGFFMIIERIKLKETLDKNKYKIINHIYTLFITLIAWVIFRANGLKNALKLLKVMFMPTSIDICNRLDVSNIFTIRNILMFVIAILLSGLIQKVWGRFKNKKKIEDIFKRFFEPFLILLLLVISITLIISGTYISYIYFKF